MQESLLHRFEQWVCDQPQSTVFKKKVARDWVNISTGELWGEVASLALHWEKAGVKRGDRVVVFAYNCVEWVVSQLAALTLGAITVGIFPGASRREIKHILSQTQPSVVVVQNASYHGRLVEFLGSLDLKEILILEPEKGELPTNAITWGIQHEEKNEARFKELLSSVKVNDPAVIVYTAGSGSFPKGAVISQANLCFSADQVIREWGLPPGGQLFSFLPLCHIAEQLQTLGVAISLRNTVSICSKFEAFSKELVEVRPTHLLCVPRVWEKMMETVEARLLKEHQIVQQLFNWAMEASRAYFSERATRKKFSFTRIRSALWDFFVLSRLRRKMGLERLCLGGSAAALLPHEVASWFQGIGIELLDNYGQTETTGILSLTHPGKDGIGTVGWPVRGIEMKISSAGEVFTKGKHVFLGYWGDEPATRLSFEGEWLKTGDLAEMLPDGRLKLVGRAKDILKTSNGKMVAPGPIDDLIKQIQGVVDACTVGDSRKYLVALIWVDSKSSPQVEAQIRQQVDEHVNPSLAAHERVKKLIFLRENTLNREPHLSPAQRRRLCEKLYAAEISKAIIGSN